MHCQTLCWGRAGVHPLAKGPPASQGTQDRVPSAERGAGRARRGHAHGCGARERSVAVVRARAARNCGARRPAERVQHAAAALAELAAAHPAAAAGGRPRRRPVERLADHGPGRAAAALAGAPGWPPGPGRRPLQRSWGQHGRAIVLAACSVALLRTACQRAAHARVRTQQQQERTLCASKVSRRRCAGPAWRVRHGGPHGPERRASGGLDLEHTVCLRVCCPRASCLRGATAARRVGPGAAARAGLAAGAPVQRRRQRGAPEPGVILGIRPVARRRVRAAPVRMVRAGMASVGCLRQRRCACGVVPVVLERGCQHPLQGTARGDLLAAAQPV